jgi:cytochrome P450
VSTSVHSEQTAVGGRVTLPPGPKAPAAWQLVHYSLYPLSFLEACGRKYGDAFTIRLSGYGTLVMLTSAAAIRDVFRGDPHVLHSGEGNEFLSISVGSTSVLVLDEEPHARQRRVLLPPLKGPRMRSYFDAIQEATQEDVLSWPRDQPVRMVEPMRRITLRVIAQAVLGLPPGPLLDDFQRRVEAMMATTHGRFGLILMKLFPMRLISKIPGMPYFRQMRQMDRALFALIDERRNMKPCDRGDNVLADLLAATHEHGEPLTNQEIRDAVVTLLLAGHETTALALAWTLERIASHSAAMERVFEELNAVTGGALPSVEHLPNLEYLDAAIREGLRTRTIVPFVVRKTKEPFVAGGREYPAGVLLSPCNHLVHHNSDLYPEPEKFRPERFLERSYAAHEWFPFGGGNRVCLGMAFALCEMKVVLSTLFSLVRLERPAGARSDPVRQGITLAPSDGAKMVVRWLGGEVVGW